MKITRLTTNVNSKTTFKGIEEAGAINLVMNGNSLTHNVSLRLSGADLDELRPVLDKFPHKGGADILTITTSNDIADLTTQGTERYASIDPALSGIHINGHFCDLTDENLSAFEKIGALLTKIKESKITIKFPLVKQVQDKVLRRIPLIQELADEGHTAALKESIFNLPELSQTAGNIVKAIGMTMAEYFRVAK